MNNKEAAREAAWSKYYRDENYSDVTDCTPEEIFKAGHAAATAEAEGRVKELAARLQDCVDAIKRLPEDIFGSVIESDQGWFIRDELIGRSEQALGKAKEATK